MLGAYCILLRRDFYRATLAVTRSLGFCGFIRPRTAQFYQPLPREYSKQHIIIMLKRDPILVRPWPKTLIVIGMVIYS